MPEITQRSFTAGELDPALGARADLAKYSLGLDTCRNFFVRAQGGAYNRPGLAFIGEVQDSSRRHRLIPFEFNTEQTYMLEFGHQTMRVIRDGGYVVETAGNITGITQANPAVVTQTGHGYSNGDDVYVVGVGGMTEVNGRVFRIANVTANTYELQGVDSTGYTAYTSGGTGARIYTLTTAYTEDDLPLLKYEQSADTMTLVSRATDIYDLTRTAHDSWTITARSFASTVTAPTGLAAVAVGSGAGSYNKTYRYVVTAFDAEGVESLASAEVSITTPSLSETAGVKITWTAVAGATHYYIYKDPSDNTNVFGFIGETKNAEFTDFNIGPLTDTAPPEDNQPFTGASNKPGAVGFYQQRQLFANTTDEPQTLFATQIANFNSMRKATPTRDDDSITFRLASRQVNEIRHIVALNELVLLTSGAEYKVSEGADFVLTPSTIGARPQSFEGASDCRPVVVGDAVLYVQEQGAKVWALTTSAVIEIDGTNRLKSSDASIMSPHLFRGKVVQEMAYAKEPHGIVWCVQDDGSLVGMTFQQEHQVQGWHRHDTDGLFESVAAVNEGGETAVYVIVNRTINGQTKRYVERMAAREEDVAEDCFYVDSGLTYAGAATTTITNLHHLEGEEVSVLADGNVVKGLTVTNGEITLPRAASKVHVGLGYLCDLKTLDIDSVERTIQGYVKSVNEVAMKTYKSRGGWVGPDFDNLLEIKPRFDEDGYDTISLKSRTEEINIAADWTEGGQVAVRQPDPLPMAILALTPSVDIGE